MFFQNLTDTSFSFVPYRGAGPALNDLMAGQIDIMFDQATNSLPQVRGGTVKAYAVTSRTRLASAPDIPTVDEAGVPGLYIAYWHAIWAPKNTPGDVIAILNAAVRVALADPAVQRRFLELGQETPPPDKQIAGGAEGASDRGDREMVADREGGEYQGGVNCSRARMRREPAMCRFAERDPALATGAPARSAPFAKSYALRSHPGLRTSVTQNPGTAGSSLPPIRTGAMRLARPVASSVSTATPLSVATPPAGSNRPEGMPVRKRCSGSSFCMPITES